MKALYYRGQGTLSLEEAPLPAFSEDGLRIRVRAAAVCGTDLRILKNGHFKIPAGQKRVLGHEISGEVTDVGGSVRGFWPGMRVAVVPNVGCGVCAMCAAGQNQLCPDYEAFGISMDGGFQEYMAVPGNALLRGNVIPLPDGVGFAEAALVEPFSCAYHAYRALDTKPGDTVLVVGAGPIGACHVMISRLAGARRVAVADISAARLGRMAAFGADDVVNTAEQDLGKWVARELGGADVVITACSVPAVQAQALELAAPRGRVNFFGGLPAGAEFVSLNTNLIHYKELRLLATTGSSVEDFRQALDIAASGRVPLEKISDARFSLGEAERAFAYAAAGEGMKAMICNS